MKANLTLVGLAAVLLSLCVPMAGFAAACPASGFNPLLVPDGTPVMETIPASGGRIYIAQLTAGRSYSLQVTSPPENLSLSAYTLEISGTLLGGAATTTDTTTIDPRIVEIELFGGAFKDHGGRRISILVSSSGGFDFTFCNTDSSNDHPLVVSLVETTLFNPLWSTFGVFETFYRFQNSTNASCNVTLRMVNDAGTQVANPSFAIPANSTAPTRTTGPTDLNLANDQAGQAIITHNCPPGAIQLDGFLGRFDLAAPVVLPIKIQTARQQQ